MLLWANSSGSKLSRQALNSVFLDHGYRELGGRLFWRCNISVAATDRISTIAAFIGKKPVGRAGECFPILMPKHPHPGMRFYFLPPYSPELNRIELLWHKMKYEWLPFKTFTPDELEQAIDEIGHGFGSQYTLTFC
ncbi:transposase [Methylomonas sp. MgM2]